VLTLVTVVAGAAVVEETTAGDPGGVTKTVVRVLGVVRGVEEITTGGRVVVGPAGLMLSVTGVRPNELQTSWNAT